MSRCNCFFLVRQVWRVTRRRIICGGYFADLEWRFSTGSDDYRRAIWKDAFRLLPDAPRAVWKKHPNACLDPFDRLPTPGRLSLRTSPTNREKQRVGMLRIEQLDSVPGIGNPGCILHHALDLILLWKGVDLFFILSGFLTPECFSKPSGTPRGSYFFRFYSRRAPW